MPHELLYFGNATAAAAASSTIRHRLGIALFAVPLRRRHNGQQQTEARRAAAFLCLTSWHQCCRRRGRYVAVTVRTCFLLFGRGQDNADGTDRHDARRPEAAVLLRCRRFAARWRRCWRLLWHRTHRRLFGTGCCGTSLFRPQVDVVASTAAAAMAVHSGRRTRWARTDRADVQAAAGYRGGRRQLGYG